MGYCIDIAKNGLAAVNVVEQRNYDLIFMRKRREGVPPIIIAITANVLSENEREGARAGMKDFARRLLPLSVWKILAGNGCDLSAKTTNH